MSVLTLEDIKAWTDLLPADFANAVGEPAATAEADYAAISDALPRLKDSIKILEFVAANDDKFISIGTAGRIRFLGWYRGLNKMDDYQDFMESITEGEEGENGGRGTTKVAPYFKQDVEAIAAVIGRRMAVEIVDGYALDVIKGAGYEVTGELEMRGGRI
ncbi:hypothetical protein [Rhizobium leguminosarum]|jgi:hypothetical protein|uniref:hypothetical protein n=1 Tax=Rhizobium leguminosarum TaxID=384 RepID=UPI002E1108CF|nr:hypothetical protein U8Q02_38135 [Rhizobium leguminosarum]